MNEYWILGVPLPLYRRDLQSSFNLKLKATLFFCDEEKLKSKAFFRFISDKCCGLLLRARKYKLLTFQGEMLFQVFIHFVRLLLTLALMSKAWRWISSTLFRVKTTSLWSRCWGRYKKSKHNSRSPATIKWMDLIFQHSWCFIHVNLCYFISFVDRRQEAWRRLSNRNNFVFKFCEIKFVQFLAALAALYLPS